MLLFLLGVSACAGHGAIAVPQSAKSAAPEGPPAVVVALIVDQFAGWIAEERLPLLPKSGGFARLRSEGTWAIDMRYAHAVTDTAPGHAALFTALVPRENGVYANDRLDPKLRQV